jgi:hypothetical protein
LNLFAQMMRLNMTAIIEVGDGSRHFENPGVSACAQSQAVYGKFKQALTSTVDFTPAMQLTGAHLRIAIQARTAETGKLTITRLIDPLIRCDLLILDEFGYLTVEPQVGPVLYEIIAGRYEKGATILTSNKSLAAWGELVGDTALMMAILDRLLHHGEVFYLRGSSYRLRGKEQVTLTTKSEELSSREKV